MCAGIYYSVLAAVRPLLNLDVAAASCLSNCVSSGIEKILEVEMHLMPFI